MGGKKKRVKEEPHDGHPPPEEGPPAPKKKKDGPNSKLEDPSAAKVKKEDPDSKPEKPPTTKVKKEEKDSLHSRATVTYVTRTNVSFERFWNAKDSLFDVIIRTSEHESVAANRIVLSMLSDTLFDLVTSSDTSVAEFQMMDVEKKIVGYIVELSYCGQVTLPSEDQASLLQAINTYGIKAVNKDDNERKRRFPYHDLTPDEMMIKFCKPSSSGGFLCNVPKCLKTFKDKNNIKQHFTNSHIEDGLIYVCPRCQAPTPNQMAFRKHIGRNHPDLKSQPLKDILPPPTFQEVNEE